MATITLTVEINCNNHVTAIKALGAGGYAGSQVYADECHYELTIDNSCLERSHLAEVIQLLMAYRIQFTIKYGE
jgi:hypothetical protein